MILVFYILLIQLYPITIIICQFFFYLCFLHNFQILWAHNLLEIHYLRNFLYIQITSIKHMFFLLFHLRHILILYFKLSFIIKIIKFMKFDIKKNRIISMIRNLIKDLVKDLIKIKDLIINQRIHFKTIKNNHIKIKKIKNFMLWQMMNKDISMI